MRLRGLGTADLNAFRDSSGQKRRRNAAVLETFGLRAGVGRALRRPDREPWGTRFRFQKTFSKK